MADFWTIDPATEEKLAHYEEHSDEKVRDRVRDALWEYGQWHRLPTIDRSALILQLGSLIRSEKTRLGELISREMGKPITQAEREIEKCAWLCDHFGHAATDLLATERIETEHQQSYIAYEPLGPVLSVMPWNFPFWQVFRFAVPALLAGNTILLKHSRNTTGCALEIEDLFRRANFPEHAFQALIISHEQVEKVISMDEIRAVTVTGSEQSGRAVASAAGRALKKTVLELGGSDPYIVFEDADLDLAVRTCVQARLVNSGQSCIAAKRFIVVESVADEFCGRFVEAMEKVQLGNPMQSSTELGPLARGDLRDDLHRQVMNTVNRGARLLCGGKIPEGRGFFYPPTVLADVRPGMSAFDEETFGPVAAVTKAVSEEEAIELANASRFGLGAAIFSSNVKRALAIAEERLEAGVCAVNTQVVSDPRLPFGGIKASGYGRELSRAGLLEFVNTKTVMVA